MFTLVAAGINKPENVCRPLKSVLPNDVVWVKDYAEEFDPENCTVYTRCGDKICYEYLVIAIGMVNEYDQVSASLLAVGGIREIFCCRLTVGTISHQH